ncbi:MAG TPA: phosphoribosylformylglycinamidine synthase subunit PurS [Methanolinea sp.]|jgi:phosphoribosylformylglycinamidine synthase|nr:phosphoribosylformylglycinamidine synthase subunit PurS [Methanolinea sp.]HOS81350.1 phosphoribosylformylglycinamidine synthase subunit PurS [Methanolinea sp.]HQE85040.1 phosphoribosylformylglycinamidine synthase subunit PurS [Methanolinea sp.]HQJ17969.1 phosphoribosylformylglycinamidine synthase subunit PurS [Methanolinea sp.]
MQVTDFLVRITISLKEGVLDPEASLIRRALENLGFPTGELKTSRQFLVRFHAENADDARKRAEAMCERLLANPVIHRYEIEVMK